LDSRDAIILLKTDIYLPMITIAALNDTDLRLSWTNDGTYGSYRVYRDTAPYFDPADPPRSTIDQSPWQFDDPAALGDPAVNHFYKVHIK